MNLFEQIVSSVANWCIYQIWKIWYIFKALGI